MVAEMFVRVNGKGKIMVTGLYSFTTFFTTTYEREGETVL